MTASTDFNSVKQETQSKIEELVGQEGKTFTNLLRNVVFAALMVFILVFAGMVLLQVIKGVIAITVSVLFGFAAIIGMKYMRGLDSVLAQKAHNWMLEQKIKEARENSIIQLKNILLTKRAEVKEAVSARAVLVGDLNKLRNELNNTSPEQDRFYGRKKEMLTSLETASSKNDKAIKSMQVANDEFENEIRMFESMEKFAATASRLAKALDKNAISDMLSLEAFDAIEERYCQAMAELETNTEFA